MQSLNIVFCQKVIHHVIDGTFIVMFCAVTGVPFQIELNEKTSGKTFQMAIPSSQVANMTCIYQGKKCYSCTCITYKIFWYFSIKLALKKYFFEYMFFEVWNKNLKFIFGGRI